MHDFFCPECEFASVGWPTKIARDARGEQHLEEHATGKPMPDQHETDSGPIQRALESLTKNKEN